MSHLDSLIGSHLSLISLQDVRYDGVLFSINAKESSIVLRDGNNFTNNFFHIKYQLMINHLIS
jgi:hypothetical protein